MFLANWFELSEVDKILAPPNDDSPPPPQHGDEEESPIWEILAPRAHENGGPSRTAADAATNTDSNNREEHPIWNILAPRISTDSNVVDNGISNTNHMVKCQHCHQLTPINSTLITSPQKAPTTPTLTPTIPPTAPPPLSTLESRVLAACTGSTHTSTLPSSQHETIYKLFGCCLPSKSSAYNPSAPSKNLKKLIRLLKNNPEMIGVRSGSMTNIVPDGMNLLHAACLGGGNVEVVGYLLQEHVLKQSNQLNTNGDEEVNGCEGRLDINDTDMQGRTALHLAAYECNIEILKVLRDAYDVLEKQDNYSKDEVEEMTTHLKELALKDFHKTKWPNKRNRFSGPQAPLDLANRNPLSLASTSPVPNAKKNRRTAEKMLYSKGDRCLDGVEKTPPLQRCGPFSPLRKGRTPSVSYLSPPPKSTRVSNVPDTDGTAVTNVSRYATPFMSPQPTTSTMGALTSPIPPLNESDLNWGVSDKPGYRIGMEDAMCVHYPIPLPLGGDSGGNPSPIGLFGVFDGHGDGGAVSQYLSLHLLSKLSSHPNWNTAYRTIDSESNSTTEGDGAMLNLISEVFHELDEDLRRDASVKKDGGSTAIVAMVSRGKVIVANVGDCRCILVKKRAETQQNKSAELEDGDLNLESLEIIRLSEDHKPNLPSERARIQSAGMSLHVDRIPPEEGDSDPTVIHKVKKSDKELLAVSRAFGDFDFKSNADLSPTRQAVICTPETVVRERHVNEDMYLILACDGIWDVMSDDEVGLFVSNKVAERISTQEEDEENDDILAKVGDDLLDLCLAKGSRDNMSVLILSFPASGFGSGLSSSGLVREDGMDGVKKLAF